MPTVLVGSQALFYWCDQYNLGKCREPKDVDYFADVKLDIARWEHRWSGAKVEQFWHDDFYEWGWTNETSIKGYQTIATLDELYNIKISHIFWATHNWEKHVHDILFMKKIANVKFMPDLFNILYPVWVEHYGKKQATFNKTKEEFFNSRVERVYDHDSLHAAVAYGDEPLYKSILKDGAEVAIDKSKYDALGYEDKLNLAREEIYATALERTLIPDPYASPRAAYAKSLKATLTSYTKGDFALFIALNLDKLYKPDVDYYRRFKENQDKLIPLGVS